MSKLQAPVIISLPYDTEEAEVEYIRKDVFDDLQKRVREAVGVIEKDKFDCGVDLDGRHSTDILCTQYALNILRNHGLIEEDK
jgi:hypothetical protein